MVEQSLITDTSGPLWSFTDDRTHTNPDGVHWRVTMRPHIWRPPTDVYETEEAIFIRVEIAGMREQDFNVALENRALSIHGIRSDTSERGAYNQRGAYHQMEIPFGEFSTEVDLPAPIISEKVEAVYKNGFLQIMLPKAHPQVIQVE